MGLDVEFYERAERLDPQPQAAFEDATWRRGDAVKAYCLDGHEHSFRGLEKGWYRVTGEAGGFAAGSYHGYGEWRRRLAVCALGVEPEEVWENPDRYRGEPFFELIRFADNEGCIGPGAAKDLASDFLRHRRRVFAAYREGWGASDPPGPEWFEALYQQFWNAFRVAAGAGLVRFM